VIDIPVEMLPAPLCAPTPLEGVEPIAAPHAGVLVFLKNLGEPVAAGDAIADLIDPVSGKVTTLRTSVAGVFFARTAHRHLLRGMAVGKIAGAGLPGRQAAQPVRRDRPASRAVAQTDRCSEIALHQCGRCGAWPNFHTARGRCAGQREAAQPSGWGGPSPP
jgi:hypothetical protein